VRTLEPSRFYVADNPMEFLNSRPEIALAISALLAQRLHSMTTYLADLKNQFSDQEDHLGFVDEVLDTLSHAQRSRHKTGSVRDPDPTVY
jgi:CRP/FNR family cyclic AMP-dependent transcriptional regulator